MQADAMAAGAAFEAVLYPNQPPGRAAFIALMAVLSIVSGALGTAFLLMGAWPVTGFFGLDVLLVYVAFQRCRRASRAREHIRLDAGGLHVRRVAPDGAATDWCFEPYWVRVHMDDPPRRDSRLTLASHGRRLAIGRFLTPEERLELAQALRHALGRYRA